MADSTGAVKHILLAKFKDTITSEQIDELIKGHAALVNLIEPMKSFHCTHGYAIRFCEAELRGTNVSTNNLHQGFTHIFESTFDSVEGIAEYLVHPAHVEFADRYLPFGENMIVVDYRPTKVV
ncbi:Stress-response A/B barrel domain-containing protein [Drosera capensis]